MSRAPRRASRRPSRGSRACRAPAPARRVIGVADSTRRSSALRCASSALKASSRPADSQPLEQLLRRSCPPRGGLLRAPRAPRPSDGSIPSASTTAASTASRERALGVGLALGDDLLLRARRRSAGRPPSRSPGARASAASGPTARAARASTSASGTSIVAPATAASSTASRNSASIRCSSASARRVADVLAQLVERVEAGARSARSSSSSAAAPSP